MQKHNIDPLYDNNSQILILGSFPSVKSRESGFFYGHPQNRFWRVLSAVFENPTPTTIAEKKKFLLSNHIAVWDVLYSCEISGSADSTIKKTVPNDVEMILNNCNIKRIFVNGKTAEKYYKKYLLQTLRRDATCLPSTSPANAAWSEELLIQAWKIIKDDLN